jgi:hypothetical protein
VKLSRERETSCAGEGDRPRERRVVCVKEVDGFFFSNQRVGFFFGRGGKTVYEIEKGKPFSKKM